jgi:hypothetical protein
MSTALPAAPFPSVDWFEAVRQIYNGDPRYHGGGAGRCDCRAAAKIGRRSFLIAFEGADCAEVGEIDDAALEDVDFYLEMPPSDWQAMIADIAEHDGASLHFTLNSLDLEREGGLARSVHGDQYREDLFFRYNQTFQYFFDASARVVTVFAKEVA